MQKMAILAVFVCVFCSLLAADDAKVGLGSLSAIPGWDIRRRSGRPLADVSENLRDDAISRSEEGEEEAENGGKEGSDILAIGPNGGAEESAADALPDFTMSPFLEKAFSMSPSAAKPLAANDIDSGGAPSTPWTTFLTFRRPTTTPQPPPIHEADLLVPEKRLPTPPAGKHLNLINENNKDKPKNQTSSSSSSTSHSSTAPFAPTMVNVQKKQEQRHCSWQMLNTFLLIWSILSTIHWLWLCSSRLFGFMHQMEVNKGKGKKNNTGGGGGGTANAPAIRQHRMRQLMMGRQVQQHQNQKHQQQKAKLCKPKIPPPLPPPPMNVNPLPPIIVRKNSSTEALTSSSAVSSGDEKRINSDSNNNKKQKQLHRTVISIGTGEPSSESIRQRKRRAAVAAALLATARRKPPSIASSSANLGQTAAGNVQNEEAEQQFYCAKNAIIGGNRRQQQQQKPAALKRKRNRQLQLQQQRQHQQKSPLILF